MGAPHRSTTPPTGRVLALASTEEAKGAGEKKGIEVDREKIDRSLDYQLGAQLFERDPRKEQLQLAEKEAERREKLGQPNVLDADEKRLTVAECERPTRDGDERDERRQLP
jgi:hypothetical protein